MGENYPFFKVLPFLASVIIPPQGFTPGLGKISQGGEKLLRNDMSSCTTHPTNVSQEEFYLANMECFIFIFFFFFEKPGAVCEWCFALFPFCKPVFWKLAPIEMPGEKHPTTHDTALYQLLL